MQDTAYIGQIRDQDIDSCEIWNGDKRDLLVDIGLNAYV